MKKIFAEVGIGNGTFFSTEYEEGESEYRKPIFDKPKHIESYYFRFWVFTTVFILSTNNGIEIVKKPKNNFKIVFGIGGY